SPPVPPPRPPRPSPPAPRRPPRAPHRPGPAVPHRQLQGREPHRRRPRVASRVAAARPLLSPSGRGGRHPERFQLTVDIIEAAGLPPLLCCDRGAAAPGPPPKPAETGGTQQRLSSWTAGCEGGDTGRLDDAEATGSTRGEGEGGSCLEVRGGSGAVAATLVESSAGKWKIQRPGHVSWDVERRDAAEGILFTAYCRGEEVALVTRQLCSGSSAEDESVQVDTTAVRRIHSCSSAACWRCWPSSRQSERGFSMRRGPCDGASAVPMTPPCRALCLVCIILIRGRPLQRLSSVI
ncbi:unnamed protein product, partial [Prorocentrum cordatum]